jgi:hypothetical protein
MNSVGVDQAVAHDGGDAAQFLKRLLPKAGRARRNDTFAGVEADHQIVHAARRALPHKYLSPFLTGQSGQVDIDTSTQDIDGKTGTLGQVQPESVRCALEACHGDAGQG